MLGEVERLRELLLGARNVLNLLRTVTRNDGTSSVFDCAESRSGSLVYVAETVKEIDTAINFLRSAAFEEMVRNDTRYRWLRERHDDDTTDNFWHVRDHNAHPVARGKLDTAIDTAMSAEGAGNG